MDRSEMAAGYLRALGLPMQAPSASFLGALTRHHVARFAFCSVGPRLGLDLPLALESLYDRIVVRERGGYCFEQNGLFFEMLAELGFSVTLYLARVIYNEDIHPGLTHRVTLVDIEGSLKLVDVGFGPLGPRMPIEMAGTESHEGDREFRVFQPRTGEFHLQTVKDGEYYSLYKFERARYGPADCELGHFYSHKHPAAAFVNNLVTSRILDGEIRSLRNREYRVIEPSGETHHAIDDAGQLMALLADAFDIRVTREESEKLFSDLP
jgi:N-hydroxyarylamine O-acetyltransferase